MKILFAIKDLNNSKGGAERVLATISSGLCELGHDTTILSYDNNNGDSYYPLDKRIKRINLGIGDSQKQATAVETISRIKAIRKTVKAENPDIIIPFMHSMFIPLALACIGCKVPVIASEHIVPTHYKDKLFQYILLILSSFLVKKFTAVSDSVKKTYPWLIRRKMIVIRNPVLLPKDNIEKLEKRHHVLLSVGRLEEQKDQETLIKAFALIAKDHPQWTLKIFGEGSLRPQLESLIKELSLEHQILLMGTTPDLAKEYANSDVFAMPSKYESFGLATAEALSYGLPSIGFDYCPGTNELIKDNINGLLVTANEGNKIEAMAAALKILISDSDLRKRLSSASQETLKEYHPDIVVNEWDEVIRSSF